MKKIIAIMLLAFCFITVASFAQESASEEWVYVIGSNEMGGAWQEVLYKPSKIVKSQETNVTKFWARYLLVPDPEESHEAQIQKIINWRRKDNKSTAGFENYLYTQMMFELDCNSQMYRVVSMYYYDKDNQIIDSWTATSTVMKNIIPESISDYLGTEICKIK